MNIIFGIITFEEVSCRTAEVYWIIERAVSYILSTP